MKLDALDHPKTFDFAARLQVSRPTAIGHLELLWAFTGKQAAQGNIGKWPDGAIARACDWMGDPTVFISALVESGFLDRDDSFRLTVHDWSHHAPGWVRAKLKKLGTSFVGSSEPPSDGSSDEDTEGIPEASLEHSILEKRSVVKRSEAKSATRAPLPAGEMAIALRDLGVDVKSTDKVLQGWLRDGFTTQQAVEAVGIARIRKPHPQRIPGNYLDPILRQPQRAPPSQIDRVTWRPPPDDEDEQRVSN